MKWEGEHGLKDIFLKDSVTKIGDVSEEILEVKEMFRKTLEYSIESIFIHDGDKILYANPSAVRLLGIEDRERVIGESMIKYLKCDCIDIKGSEICCNNKEMQLFEGKLLTEKNKILDVEIAKTFLYYREKIEVLIYVRDITSKKEMESGLKDKEFLLNQITGNTQDLLSVTDKNGNYKYNTPSFKEILGYNPNELCGTNMLAYIHPVDLSNVNMCLQKMKLTGNKTKMQYKTKCSDGTYVHLETVMSPIHNNGQIDGFILSSRDISDRVEAEEALRESEKKYRRLVELLPYAVYIKDKDKILFSNKAGLELLNEKDLEALKQKKLEEIFVPHESYKKQYIENITFTERNGYMPLTDEMVIRLSDNRVLNLETMITKFNYENEDDFLVLSRDISDRKKAEELEKDMEEKNRLLDQAIKYERIRTDFFANVSHELRTPINVILSALQVVNQFIEYENIDKIKKYIGTMTQNCYRLIRLINNLIDTTKIEAGYFEINLHNCNIVSVVEEITQLIVGYVENKGISILFDTDVEERIIACDIEKIERIILNLISNAIKFTEPGGSIFVNMTDKNDKVVISVRDTGIGIPREKQKKIFERFVQVDNYLTRNREGSGIGLSLVKSLVEMHKGKIQVVSECGKGSEFIIELPVTLISSKDEQVDECQYNIQDNMEKINIEFSDIYM